MVRARGVESDITSYGFRRTRGDRIRELLVVLDRRFPEQNAPVGAMFQLKSSRNGAGDPIGSSHGTASCGPFA